jgi:glycolate oxidase FAD binding subunit
MLGREVRDELARAVGEGGLAEHGPEEVDGVPIATTLRPADGDALAGTLSTLSRLGVGALVRGGGSRLALGNPPRGARVFLSTERLRGIDSFDPGEGVCHAAGGTPLAELRAAVAAGGWELPLDPPGERASLGGVVAAAALGPRALGLGRPRDGVLGLEVALASGERTRCGGRVVKNVTGYDLNKLYTGSLGTLGVIEGCWLRLRPLPARVRVLEAQGIALDRACARGLAAARRPAARVAALVAPSTPGEAARLVVELAGEVPSVERDAGWLEAELGAGDVEPGAVDALRELQGGTSGELCFRVAALPSRLDAALAELRGAGAAILAHPGLGLLYAGLAVAEGDGERLGAAFGAAARAARVGGGSWVLEAAPSWAKRGRDVFSDEHSGVLPLARALKARFDPQGVLNPGRFAGFL